MIIQKMTAEHLDAVVAIEQSGYDFPWGKGIFSDCLQAGYLAWVIEDNQQVLGYVIMAVGIGESHLLNICVDTNHRGRCLGYQLLQHAIDQAGLYGAAHMFLEVAESNAKVIDLYKKNDFEVVAKRKNYYPTHKGREDAIIMRLELNPHDEDHD